MKACPADPLPETFLSVEEEVAGEGKTKKGEDVCLEIPYYL